MTGIGYKSVKATFERILELAFDDERDSIGINVASAPESEIAELIGLINAESKLAAARENGMLVVTMLKPNAMPPARPVDMAPPASAQGETTGEDEEERLMHYLRIRAALDLRSDMPFGFEGDESNQIN